jgi:DNA-directed RNA polymerase specialized sigma24 family protein
MMGLPDVWLYATARRVVANQHRSTRRQAALYERLALLGPSPVQDPPASDPEEALVHEALRRLRPRDRELLLLSEWEGLTPTEIAVVVGCLAMTARGRLHRARRRFRESPARQAPERPAGAPDGPFRVALGPWREVEPGCLAMQDSLSYLTETIAWTG